MSQRVKDKVALVMGAGSIGPGWGNGKAAAVRYAREGARVFAVDIQESAAQETRQLIEAEGGQCIAFQTDVSQAAEVDACVASCVGQFGRIDILHNNVGLFATGGVEDVTEAEWDHLFAVNVKSMYLTCKACLPQMVRQRRGAIVNISAIAAMRHVGYSCISYAAGKAAVNQLTRSIAVDYAQRGIRANTILPGLIHTPLVEHFLGEEYAGDVQKMIERRRQIIPMKHFGDAWDVAAAALFLASDEARYITGAELVVDGGVTCSVA
ncbi:MAG: 3-oxoacyl-ACP reductase [Planctomycetaceae bacterium]|nr:3-oxoacyl-ACP reductase [Planctomycetaceae bacterium]